MLPYISINTLNAFILKQPEFTASGIISLHSLKTFVDQLLAPTTWRDKVVQSAAAPVQQIEESKCVDEGIVDRRRTKICQAAVSSMHGCKYGKQCIYAHSPHDIVITRCGSREYCMREFCIYLHDDEDPDDKVGYFKRMRKLQGCKYGKRCTNADTGKCTFAHY